MTLTWARPSSAATFALLVPWKELPLILSNPTLRSALGFLFSWNMCLLLIVLISSTLVHRPFCKYLCPLGATYALFSKYSLYQMSLDKTRCTNCGHCESVCPMNVSCRTNINSPECIRCGKCKHECPVQAIEATFGFAQGTQGHHVKESSQ